MDILKKHHNVKAEANFNKGSIYHEAIWKNSYEAEEHIKRYGYSDEPVCHTLIRLCKRLFI